MNASAPAPALRVSVRALVAFSIFGPDITPMNRSDLEAGTRAHLLWQGDSELKSETPVAWEGEAGGLRFVVSGRMDLYDPLAKPPRVEEIKLLRGDPPAQALPAHRAQAVCYAFMLAERDGLDEVRVCISYVGEEGALVCEFVETLRRDALREAFYALLLPYAAWQARLSAQRERRNASIAALPFPYPSYRPGQRELAAQVYTAIARGRRLYAAVPTGAGKSAAVLYPAVKALGMGLTGQLFYLTARTTARRAALNEIALMRSQGLEIHALTLNAKEKLCPHDSMRCSPEHCSRAAGHYVRQPDALEEALTQADWDTGSVLDLADRHHLCPFEFSLCLAEEADIVICDYNYAFDPKIMIRRIFQQSGSVTLLMDEAHNMPGRVRDMLSGALSSAEWAAFRREDGKLHGRKTAVYRAAGRLVAALRSLEPGAEDMPDGVLDSAEALKDALFEEGVPWRGGRLPLELFSFLVAAGRRKETPGHYKLIVEQQGRERLLRLFCLDITDHIAAVTKKMQGCVFFSATLRPLEETRRLLGGSGEDACFSLPSPFPPDNLLVLQLSVNTRYVARQDTAQDIADAVAGMYLAHPGKYIVFFPSYAYLRMVQGLLAAWAPALPLHVQDSGMDDAARSSFLARFTDSTEPLLALCVLGGVFAEGIDLPGLALIGVCVVGVGLPQVNGENEALRAHYQLAFGSGYGFAYRYPGMHKVLQAAGRVIRSEEDRGVVLLLDDRYAQATYRELLPEHYRVRTLRAAGDIGEAVRAFWS